MATASGGGAARSVGTESVICTLLSGGVSETFHWSFLKRFTLRVTSSDLYWRLPQLWTRNDGDSPSRRPLSRSPLNARSTSTRRPFVAHTSSSTPGTEPRSSCSAATQSRLTQNLNSQGGSVCTLGSCRASE